MRIQGNWETREVKVDGKELDPKPSQEAWNHSPDGFAWGFGGSGPAQLALAILLAAGYSKEVAVSLHQAFKWDHVIYWPQADFDVEVDVDDWVKYYLDREAGEP